MLKIQFSAVLLSAVTFSTAATVSIPLSDSSTHLTPGAPVQIALVPTLFTSFTLPSGSSSPGAAQAFLYKNDATTPAAAYTFDAGTAPAGRYFVGMQELNVDSTPIKPFRVLNRLGEPTPVFFGAASREPLQIGCLRVTPSDSVLIATFGLDAGTDFTLSLTQGVGRAPVFTFNSAAPPNTGVVGSTLQSILPSLSSGLSNVFALLRQPDSDNNLRYTFVLKLSGAPADSNLTFSLIENLTNKILKEGAVGSMHVPSVQDWVAIDYQKLKGSTPSAPSYLVGLLLMAHQGLAHADMQPPSFEFEKEAAPFSDYTQMATAFNPALAGGSTLANLFTVMKSINTHPLQDPIELKLKPPKDNAVFIDGYSALELDSSYAPTAISNWRTRLKDSTLALYVRYSKNIALFERDPGNGKYAFKPLYIPDPSVPPVPDDPSKNGVSLLLPLTPGHLDSLLKKRVYVKGNGQAMKDPEELFYLSIRVVRCPMGVNASQVEQVVLDPIPSAGRVFSGPEKSAFQIWAYDGNGKVVKNAQYGQYMVRGQTRKLAYVNAYKLGTGVDLEVTGRDVDSVEVDDASSMEGAGNALVKTRRVTSGGSVGTGLGGLVFRAVDYSVKDGDTLVERVFERKGALFGLGLVVPTVEGPVNTWPATVERDVVSPVNLFYSSDVGLPSELQASGKLKLWIDDDAQVYSDFYTQSPSTRLFPGDPSIEGNKINLPNRTGYSFDLTDPNTRELLLGSSGLLPKLRAIVAGSQVSKSFSIVYKPDGENGDYLQEELITTFGKKDCVAKIAGDFLNTGRDTVINQEDFEFSGSHSVSHWSTDYTAEVYKKHENLAGADNYKLNMDMIPLKVVKTLKSGQFEIGLKNGIGTDLSFKFATMPRLLKRQWVFGAEAEENGDNPKTTQYYNSVNELKKEEYFPLAFGMDTLGLLVAGHDPARGTLKVLIGNDGHFAEVDTVQLGFHDIENEIAVYSSRYVKNEGEPDSLAKMEGIGKYYWENGKLLSDAKYGRTTYNLYPLMRLERFGGKDFASIGQFDPAKRMMVFVHGFNSKEMMDETYATEKTFLKKLRLQGYDGSFVSFHWYGDFNPGGKNGSWIASKLDETLFMVDQLNAFKSSEPLLRLLADTLGGFANKQLLVHSLGNQVVMDMLRLNAEQPEPEDLGVTKYNILEAAIPQSMLWPKKLGESLELNTNWIGIANMVGATYSSTIPLNNFMRDDDRVVGVAFRANQYLKPLLGPLVFGSAMRSNFNGSVPDDYTVTWTKNKPMSRQPIHLAAMYASESLLSRTLPQDGVPDSLWANAKNIDVQGTYNRHEWDCKDKHSYLNVDQAYKTRFIVDEILK